jgi:hypothetical protein
LVDVDLLVEANSHMIAILPRNPTSCAQLTPHKLDLCAGGGQ